MSAVVTLIYGNLHVLSKWSCSKIFVKSHPMYIYVFFFNFLLRMWKSGCGDPQNLGYTGWREMYILRPRPCFNGCYISKATYSRPGENSFQDVNYKPWHMVSYFRYLRFYSCGSVLMLTTGDAPQNVVSSLKKDLDRCNLVKGSYSLHGNIIMAVFRKKAAAPEPLPRFRRKKNQNTNTGTTIAEYIFPAVRQSFSTNFFFFFFDYDMRL